MSEAPEITPLEVLEVLADGQRKLLEFVKQRLSLYGRQDASCALNQMVKQAAAFAETLHTIANDYDVEQDDACRLLDYANGEISK
jgi:hypothetical protein